MKFFKEFKEFAMKGNLVDMAVGVIVGGAFGKIITSLVNDIIMPLIGTLLGGTDFSSAAVTLVPATADKEAVMLNYGAFIQNIVDFLIIAFSIFLVVKAINKAKKKQEEAAPAEPPKSEVLLEEIRDLLKKD